MQFYNTSCSTIIILYFISLTNCASNGNEEYLSNGECLREGADNLQIKETSKPEGFDALKTETRKTCLELKNISNALVKNLSKNSDNSSVQSKIIQHDQNETNSIEKKQKVFKEIIKVFRAKLAFYNCALKGFCRLGLCDPDLEREADSVIEDLEDIFQLNDEYNSPLTNQTAKDNYFKCLSKDIITETEFMKFMDEKLACESKNLLFNSGYSPVVKNIYDKERMKEIFNIVN